MEDTNTTYLNVKIPIALKQEFKSLAVQKNVTLNELVLQVIEDFLEQEGI